MRALKKIPGGKLVEIEFSIKNNTIKSINITGDFFAYPEWCIEEIEKCLAGRQITEIKNAIDEKLRQNGFQIIGFSPEDIEKMVLRSFHSD